jgi:hypothetical protein
MLKNETEYRRAVQEVTEQHGRLEQQIERLRRESLSDEQVRVASLPSVWAWIPPWSVGTNATNTTA